MPRITSAPFGRTPDGDPVLRFTLEGGPVIARVMTLGATLTGLLAPDRDGRAGPILLGADTLEPFLARFPAAATIGRVANRIAAARFTLDGVEHRLEANEGRNHLHGGSRGLDRVVWNAGVPRVDGGRAEVTMTHASPDGHAGYPGDLEVSVTFSLDEQGVLRISYRATTDRATPVNLTNHAYFNLAGAAPVLDHELWLDADAWTPVDDELIPTGAIAPVDGTPLDFRRGRRIGERIESFPPELGGYDHNLVLRASRSRPEPVARLSDRASGRTLEIVTMEPAIQLYTANRLEPVVASAGRFGRHGAVCLETQHFPDAVHHPVFPSVILRPGEVFESETSYAPGVDGRPT
jgi:aldose 1-epimerase